MNKRIKKKRERELENRIESLEMHIDFLIDQNNQLWNIVEQNAQATNNELKAVKDVAFDNQTSITEIAIDVNYIKKNYKRKWGEIAWNTLKKLKN